MIVKQQKPSDRQILFNRVTVDKLADRLSRNLQKINLTESRLSFSRCRSSDSTSRSSIKRANSVADLINSDSKTKLLKNITQKLKQSRSIIDKSPQIVSNNNILQQRQSFNTSRKRKTKLQEMLKDIKKCNQMSTKAVHSIKKNISDTFESSVLTNLHTNRATDQVFYNNEYSQTEKRPSTTQLTLLFEELNSLKKEMSRLKEDNAQLINFIKRNHSPQRKNLYGDSPCALCGCNCKSQRIKSNCQRKLFNND